MADSEATSATPEQICANPECGKPATMVCPTCVKLGLPPSRFCNQTCFKNYWSTHKQLHKLVSNSRTDAAKLDPSSMPTEFDGYTFTGSLRPYQKTARRPVPRNIVKPDYADHIQGVSVSEQRDRRTNSTIRIYTEDEIEGVRRACRIGREVLDIVGNAVRVGITCDELDQIVHDATIERDAYPSPLNYYLFPKSVCTSVNEIICHGIPDMRPLEDGDIVNLDISVYHGGYHGDLNETFMVGNVNDDSRRLVECAYQTLSAAINIAKPGTLYRECGTVISKLAKKYKCSVVKSYCGHGIGTQFHTAPNVPHYANNKAKGEMKPGHIFTIEPMINLGQYDDVLWPDGWTAATRDGSRSAQFEHTMLVTETGVELLTGRIGEPTDHLEWTPEKFQR